MTTMQISETRDSFHNAETLAPGECREIHIGPAGELGWSFVTPIEKIVKQWGYRLLPAETQNIDPTKTYLFIVSPTVCSLLTL